MKRTRISKTRHASLTAIIAAASLHSTASLAQETTASDSEEVSATEILVLGRSFANDVTGAKALAPIKETPSSVTLITAERIEDQRLLTLEDALNKTVGVTSQKIVSSYPRFFARGFEVSSFLLDGVPQQGFAQAPYAVPDLFLFDRLEYLRGPSGLFSGSGSPGGSINLVRKRPKDDFAFSASLTGGSWNFLRGELDLSAPVNESGSIKTRVGLMYQDADDFIDTVRKDRVIAFGAMEFELGDRTAFTVGGFYDDLDSTITVGLPTDEVTGLIDFPRNTLIGADGQFFRTKQVHGYAELRHEFGDRWTARATIQHNNLDREEKYSFGVFGLGVNSTNNGVLDLQTFTAKHDANNFSADVNVVGEFDLLGNTSGIILGADYQKARWHSLENGYYFGTGDPLTSIDVFDPVPRPAIPPIAIDPTGIGYFDFLQNKKQYGIYGQARLKLAQPFTVVLGGRVGWAKQELNYTTILPGNLEISAKASPYAGFVFDLNRDWSVYGSYASVFQPQDAIDAAGQPIGPLSGNQFEAGIKGNVFSDAILLTLAVYRLRQSNRAVPDPNDFTSLIGSGEVEAKGIELEINGQITPNWTINGGYVYTTNRFVDQTATGQFIPIIPKHNIRLFTDYEFDEGSSLSGLSLGAAIDYNSSRRVDAIIREGSYVVVDLRAGYDVSEHVNFSVNVNNVFDEKYYNSLFNATFGNVYGTPRSAFATLRLKY